MTHRWANKRPGLPLTTKLLKRWATADELGVPTQKLQALTTLGQADFRYKPGRKGFPCTNIMQWRKKQ